MTTKQTLTPEVYWKFRAEESDRQRLQERAQMTIMQIEAARKVALTSLGLDIDREYRFDDTTCTIEEIQPK